MTLGTIRSLVRNMTLERAGDTGLITDPEANDLINLAARLLFVHIATKYPDVFAQRSASSVPVPANCVVAYSAITAGAVFRMLNAYAGATGAAESAMSMVNNFDRAADRHVYEPTTPAPALPYRWYVEGENVGFSPVTAGTFDARFTWVEMPADMVGDTAAAWGGKLVAYHDFIVNLAVLYVLTKDTPGPQALVSIYGSLDSMLSENFGSPPNPYNDRPRNPYNENPRENRP